MPPPIQPSSTLLLGPNMEQYQEQAAGKMKALAISQMKRRDFEGAWLSLNGAKRYLPGLLNLDIMLFVCNILRLADAKKPGYGVNWLEFLHLPISANNETIQSKFKYFIYCIERIKTEFPGTTLALRILEHARRNICSKDISEQVNSPPVAPGMISPKFGANRESCGAVKRKMPTSDCSSERDNRNHSSLKKHEKLRNANDALEQVAVGSTCQGVDDTYLISSSEITAINNDEDAADEHHAMKKPTAQMSGSVESKLVGAEQDDGVSRCQSNNAEDAENQVVDSLGQFSEAERATMTSTHFSKKQSLTPDTKLSLFRALPQNPHYDPLHGFSPEFRKSIIMGIESSFVTVATQIRSLVTEEDVKRDISIIRNQLRFLGSMGFDIYMMQLRVAELCRLVDEKDAVNVACKERYEELKDWKSKSSALEEENCVIRSLIVHLEQEIQKLKSNLEANEAAIKSQNDKVTDIEIQIGKRSEECRWLDSEIEWTAKLPW